MARQRAITSPRLSPALALFVVAAVAFGAAAAFLAAPLAPTSPHPASSPVVITTGAIEFGAAAFVIVLVGGFLALNYSPGKGLLPGRLVTTLLVGLLIAVVLAVVLHFATSGGSLSQLVPGPSTPPTSPITPSPNASGGTGLPSMVPEFAVGVEYILLFLVVAVALLLLTPFLLRRRKEPAGIPRAAESSASVRRTLEAALHDLETDEGTDPRSLIVALYARLLERVDKVVEDVEFRTPREIQRDCLVRLGIDPKTGDELTGLFEEARYSTHELGRAEAERAKVALRNALADLNRPIGIPA